MSDVQEQVLALPWADHLQEFLVLRALDDGIHPTEILSEYLVQGFCLVKQQERLAEHLRDVPFAFIGVTFELF